MTDNPTERLIQKIRDNKKSLNIARLPDKTKEDFIALANEGFCGDYGMALREVLNSYFEHHTMKALFFQNIDLKLDSIMGLISQKEEKEQKPETSTIKMCDGSKRIIKEVNKK